VLNSPPEFSISLLFHLLVAVAGSRISLCESTEIKAQRIQLAEVPPLLCMASPTTLSARTAITATSINVFTSVTLSRSKPRIAYLPLDQITVGKRCRQDVGDLSALMTNIRERRLLQPLIITPDRQLLAGYRRLEASRRLGYARIQVTVARELTDVLALLRVERAENTCRQPLTPSEAVAMVNAIQKLECTTFEGRPTQRERGHAKQPAQPTKRPMRDALAEMVCDLSSKTLEKAEVVVDAAEATDVEALQATAQPDACATSEHAAPAAWRGGHNISLAIGHEACSRIVGLASQPRTDLGPVKERFVVAGISRSLNQRSMSHIDQRPSQTGVVPRQQFVEGDCCIKRVGVVSVPVS
jgi:hypothetical protein